MTLQNLFAIGAIVAVALPVGAQDFHRRATFTNGGDPARGKCTAEVVVDGAAEITIRGDSADIRNLSGQAAQWRRFECNGPLPSNPVGFRFAGVDGRGRQDLIRDPRNGGVAVVRIEDPQGGAEGYTFDLFWDNRGGAASPGYQTERGYGNGGDRGYGNGNGNRGGNAFAADDAVRVCRESITQQAAGRFRARDVQFRRIAIDDQPGRNDWVVGNITVTDRGGREEAYRFSCSVDFQSGRIRSANIDAAVFNPGPVGGYNGGNNRQVQVCQRAIEDRLRTDGYDRVEVRSISAEGRARVNGQAAGFRRDGPASFDFSCILDPRDGDVRSVDVRRR